MYKMILLLIFGVSLVFAEEFDPLRSVPTSYKGRFRPVESEARLWLEEISHEESKGSHELFWKLHFLGHESWDNDPLFWIGDAKLKELLGLNENLNHFSYNQLRSAIYDQKETNLRLMHLLITYHFFKSYRDPFNRSKSEKIELTMLSPGLWAMFRQNDLILAVAPRKSPWNYLEPGALIVENGKNQADSYIKKYKKTAEESLRLLSVMGQYASMQELFVLPSRRGEGEWLPLKALNGAPVANFTLYSDETFYNLRDTYNQLVIAVRSGNGIEKLSLDLSQQLNQAYRTLEGKPYKEASGKMLVYPTHRQLATEQIYYNYPFSITAIILYAIGMALLCFNYTVLGTASILLGFALHTILLAMRIYILDRPPVSNMFETVIYVPWISLIAGFILHKIFRSRIPLIAASLVALILLSILEVSHINRSLENVQAVLDSQYWLIIHVLLVVGSYGVFALCGILGHFYLIGLMKNKIETPKIQSIGNAIIQGMYVGLAMLIPGTILGGVWAAQSWGRFWDWDPKESWAFISICTYLICVHAYRFHHIKNFGLAVGAVVGLQVISFTWYGVNYILGTGLHSYGFGSGTDFYYYSFLLAETIFLIFAWRTKKAIDKKNFYVNLKNN